MNGLRYVFVFAATFVLQLFVAPLFAIKDTRPDFILIAVIAVALRKGQIWGVLGGFACGVLWDTFGTEFVGLSALSKSVAGYVSGFFAGGRLDKRLNMLILFLVSVILLHDVVYFTILSIGTPASFWEVVVGYLLGTTAYTLVMAFLIHLLWPSGLWGLSRRVE